MKTLSLTSLLMMSADGFTMPSASVKSTALFNDESGTADVSIPYDAAAKNAYEASDKSMEYDAFKTKFEADAVADVIAKSNPETSEKKDDAEAPKETAKATESSRTTSRIESDEQIAFAYEDPKAFDNLKALAEGQNVVLRYYDPLGLAEKSFWDQGEAATIGFLRQAEIKHGRVAMAAVVGFIVQSNGIRWPFDMQLDGASWPSSDLSPEAQWDAIPQNAKLQIVTFIGLLELLDEGSCGDLEGRPHYMRGGKPGAYPNFEIFPNLYDPFNLFKKMDEEKKAKRLNIEVNNGRLAMIGIFGFLAADAVPGSVPFLNQYAQPYDGNIMAPFGADFTLFS